MSNDFKINAVVTLVGAIAALIIFGTVFSRVEVCRTYYAEITLFSCLNEFPGLPARKAIEEIKK